RQCLCPGGRRRRRRSRRPYSPHVAEAQGAHTAVVLVPHSWLLWRRRTRTSQVSFASCGALPSLTANRFKQSAVPERYADGLDQAVGIGSRQTKSGAGWLADERWVD